MHDIVLYNDVKNDEIYKRDDNEAVLEMETLAYDYQWRQRAGDLYSLIPPSYYYIYTPEEIKKMKRKMVDSIRAILEEEEQADGQKDTEKI